MRVLFLLAVAISLVSCSMSENPHFTFVLPEGFSGVFVVKREKNPSLDPTNHVINVNETGVAIVHSEIPLDAWHTASAKFSSDEKIAVEPTHPDGIGLRYLTTNSRGESFFVIGTKSDEDNFHLNRNDRSLGGIREAGSVKK